MASTDEATKVPEIKRPIASELVPWEEWKEGERFGSRFRHLTKAAVGAEYRVGVSIEELPPGKQFRFVMIGERKRDDVCVYPDSNKVLVRSLGQVLDRGAVKEYWDGEDVEGTSGRR